MKQGVTILKNFISSDLALSATLLSKDLLLETIDKTDPRKALFVFKDTQTLQEIIEKYWRKELLVEPRQYFDNLKALKARIYQ